MFRNYRCISLIAPFKFRNNPSNTSALMMMRYQGTSHFPPVFPCSLVGHFGCPLSTTPAGFSAALTTVCSRDIGRRPAAAGYFGRRTIHTSLHGVLSRAALAPVPTGTTHTSVASFKLTTEWKKAILGER